MESGGVEVDDAGFDVVARVDEWESVGCAVAEVVGVARAGFVEDGGDGGEGLVFVGAANMLVGFDLSAKRLSLMLRSRWASWMWDIPRRRRFSLLLFFEPLLLPLPFSLLFLCSFRLRLVDVFFYRVSELFNQRLTFSHVLALSQAEFHVFFSGTMQVSHLDFSGIMLVVPHVALKLSVIRHEFDFDVLQCDHVAFIYLTNGKGSMGIGQSDLQN